MEDVVALLTQLVTLPGIPGREEAVADFLMEYAAVDAVSRRIDPSGNVWIECEGPAGPPVVFCAHMDEVGWKVKRVDENGRVSVVGHERTDLRTLGGEVVRIWTAKGPLPAFVDSGQQTNLPKDYANMTAERVELDLGVVSRAEVEALGVKVGDPITYDATVHRLAGDVLCAKAFDDRSGLAAILKGIEYSAGNRKQRPLLLGTVQEEIGGHGAHAVEFEEKPGAVFILDICGGEVYGLPVPERRPMLGRGPILHDGPVASQGLLRRVRALAEERGIPYQHLAVTGRGADLSILQQKSGGLPALGIILPMAFYHSPRGLIHAGDVHNAGRLIGAVLEDPDFLEHTSKW
ncbi:MAG: hypothetical protein ACYS47_16565 [Planctomycetota bacterium]|jgi:endoglucanase